MGEEGKKMKFAYNSHIKLKDKYKEQIESVSLKEQKEKYRKIKQFDIPVTKDDLDEREKEYLERKKLKMEQLRLEREKYYADIGQGNYDPKKYTSKYLENHLEELRIKKMEEEKSKEKHKKAEKMLSYAKIVKEMHWPEISERKRAQVKQHKKELKR